MCQISVKLKRIDTIIDTFALIREHIQSKLLLIGDGPELHDMRIKVREMGLSDDVLFFR